MKTPSILRPAALKLSLCAALLGAAALPLAAAAQDYPSRAITIQMPTGAGSSFDVILRAMQPVFDAATGGKSYILNPALGGNGTIAPSSLLRAEPDGQTIALTYAGPMTLSPLTMATPPYDPLRDFAPISLLTKHGVLFIASPKFPPNSLTEAIALAKSKPGGLSVSYAGPGVLVSIIQIGAAAGVKFLEVPYKDSNMQTTAAMSGEVDIASGTVGLNIEQIKAGKLKAVFIGSKNRSPLLPNVPALGETFPNVEAVSWFALIAPAKTPADRITWLNRAFVGALKDPKVTDLIVNKNGYDLIASTPAVLADQMKSELAVNARIVKEYSIKE